MIRDQETINALVDIIERFVRERLIPAEDQMAEEGKQNIRRCKCNMKVGIAMYVQTYACITLL